MNAVKLTPECMRVLIGLYPGGCDVIAAWLPDYECVHAQALDGSKGCLVGLSQGGGTVREGEAGCLGISRDAYLRMLEREARKGASRAT